MARKGNHHKNGLGRTTVLPEKKEKTRLQEMNGDSTDPSISHSFEERDPSYGLQGAARNKSPMTHSEKEADSPLNSDNMMGQHGLSYVLYSWSSASVLSVLKVATQWLEKQKPLVDTLVTFSVHAYDYVCIRSEYLSPIIWKWVMHSGRLALLLSMLWLDCSLRGLDSLLRFGTTSFLAVFWCSILSVMAMVGISKFFLMLVLVGSLAIFASFSLSLLVTAIFAIVVLCIYGSFWITGFAILGAGIAFGLSHERIALSIATVYSIFCAQGYVGWLGLLLGLNLSFFSSDLLIYFLKNNMSERGPSNPHEPLRETRGSSGGRFYVDPEDAFQAAGEGLDRDPGMPSSSGTEAELTSEDEVARLLNSTDHYSALGLSRYGEIDSVYLKREYRKKAMLVHPDKNMGNEKAAEAFKKLQNAYEVLLDSLKRKAYDDELRREELLNYFRRLQNSSQNNGRHGIFASGNAHTEADNKDSHGLSRRIACKKCNMFHDWILTERLKSRSRWCQDCKDFHQAKDGDGWVEQSFHPLLFGLLQKAGTPAAYVCAESRIYDVTGWFICQAMTCPANTHKPSFHVNTSITFKQPHANGYNTSHKGRPNPPNMDESMTEEDFFEWLQNAVQSGIFETKHSPAPENPSAKTGSSKGSGGKRKKKGKKQW